MVSFNACKSDSNKVSASDKGAIENTMPSDERIQNFIFENSQYFAKQGYQIVGKRKISDNEYSVYFSYRGDVNVEALLYQLDNGMWVIHHGDSTCSFTKIIK